MEPFLLIVDLCQLRQAVLHLQLTIQRLIVNRHLEPGCLRHQLRHHVLRLEPHPFHPSSHWPCVKGDPKRGVGQPLLTLFRVIPWAICGGTSVN